MPVYSRTFQNILELPRKFQKNLKTIRNISEHSRILGKNKEIQE